MKNLEYVKVVRVWYRGITGRDMLQEGFVFEDDIKPNGKVAVHHKDSPTIYFADIDSLFFDRPDEQYLKYMKFQMAEHKFHLLRDDYQHTRNLCNDRLKDAKKKMEEAMKDFLNSKREYWESKTQKEMNLEGGAK